MPRRVWFVLTALGAMGGVGTTGVASGQLVPPAPAKTPKETYTPPPAAPAAPSPPARPDPEVETPLPSIVKKGPDGKVIRLNMLPEQAALDAMPFDEAGRKRIAAGVAEYQADMDRRVIENPGLIVQLVRQRDTIANYSTLQDLQQLTAGIGPLRPGSLLERLQRNGAINARQKHRADQVKDEYNKAITAEVNAEAGEGDFQKTMTLGGRRVFMEMSAEAVRSLDRQLARAEPNMEQIVSGLSMSEVQKNQASMLLSAGRDPRLPEDKRLIVRRTNLKALFMEVLNDEQRAQLLKAASPELVLPKPAEPTKSGG